jgi:hypothetical protein
MTQQQMTGQALHWVAGPLNADVTPEGTLTVTVTDGDDLRTVTLVDLKALAEVTSANEAAYISALLVGSACKAHGLNPDDLQPVKDPEVGF